MTPMVVLATSMARSRPGRDAIGSSLARWSRTPTAIWWVSVLSPIASSQALRGQKTW